MGIFATQLPISDDKKDDDYKLGQSNYGLISTTGQASQFIQIFTTPMNKGVL